jgi:hypothetical protein
MRKLTTAQFIEKSKVIHGGKYDYSLVDYQGSKMPVIIICNQCDNNFQQTPNAHLHGYNCPVCADTRKTTEEFIEDARKVHGYLYNYSEVNYINNKTLITIICEKHGRFDQEPSSHLKGTPCPICSRHNSYTYNFDIEFFKEKKDSPESFYVAGFLAGDGCLTSGECAYTIVVCLKSEDKPHLEKLLKLLKSNHPIYDRKNFDKRTQKEYTGCAFNISCKEMYYDLERFGITPQKSLTYDIPDWILTHKYVSHFIRGIFDADGCISFDKKERSDSSIKYDGQISFVGTKSELSKIHKVLYRDCELKELNKAITQNKNIYTIEYGGNIQSNTIMNYLYKDADKSTILDRKYERFLQLQDAIKETEIRKPLICGENNYQAAFSNEEVKQIRTEFKALKTIKKIFIQSIADKFEVSFATVKQMVYGRTYKNVA